MNVEDIQSARSDERRTDSLQPLPDSFYDDAGAFVRELRAKREEVAAAADDPFDSADVRRLTDSIETAENTVEAIYERRVGKVLKLASLDAAGMTTDDDGLTPEERDLLETLTGAIEHNREHVIEGLAHAEDGGENGGEAAEAIATGTDPTETASDTEDPAVDSATDTEPESARTGETNGTDGVSDGNGNADAIGAANAMGAPAGTAASGSGTRPDRAAADAASTGDGASVEDGAPEAATGSSSALAAPAEANGEGTASAVDDRTAGVAVDDRAGDEPADEPADGEPAADGPGTIERETVRVTRDVGEIVGIDERVYELTSETVVRLPAANARPLVDRDAAERLTDPPIDR
jgi:DNA replication factor GINS